MKEQMQKMIREARLSLRAASGQGLSIEEQAEQEMKIQIAKLDDFIMWKLRVTDLMTLEQTTAWTDKGPALLFKLDGEIFHLRQLGDAYVLFTIKGSEEHQILSLTKDDPQFGNKMIVAMADSTLLGQ